MKKEKLLDISHNVFKKYDIIGVIADGGPEDEYQMEESKISQFIYHNEHATENDIYLELIKIIEDWFGEKPLHEATLKMLPLMAKDLYDGIHNK